MAYLDVQFSRSAEDRRASLLAAAKPEGIYGEQASEADSLRAKIQQAIRALQEGLLERSTEVKPCRILGTVRLLQGANSQ